MANNCKAVFVNNTPLVCTVTDNGDGTYTFNNHIDPPITWSTGGADTDTSIVFNQVLPNGNWEFNVVDVLTNTVLTTFTVPAPTISIIDNGDNTFTYIDVAGNPTVISYEHTLVDNNDGTFTFTQPDGTPITIDVCKLQQDSGCAATMVDNGDGTYTYTDINGVSTTFTGGIANVLTTITNTVTGHKIADYTDENGGVTTIYETISTLINNGDGTATFTNEDGTAITFPIGGVSIVDNTDGTYLVTLADGSTITIGDTSISTLVDNGDNTYTYTDETGVVTTFDVTGVLTTVTNTIVGNKIADYTDEAGGVTPIYESITSFASITNGWQFTSEDGTVTTVAYLFDNATPSTPNLLVQVNGTTQASIPLNSYDVNIATTGGFTFNPTTDQITIKETDGETHVIDLTPLRTTLTSVDNSVEIVPSVNPDGSTNYDLGVKDKFHTNIVATAPYDPLLPLTGWVAPSGAITGNTVEVKFTDGTIANYTFDGSVWVLDFVVENKAINNLQVVNEIIERGNVSLGGGQPADFTRNTYNWLGANFQDKWQSAGDANLFDIKANQTINAANTTNSGAGAVNIGINGANGQYKLNVGGAIWLDNGRGSVFIGQNAGQLDATSESIGVGRFALGENTGGLSTSIGAASGYNNTGTSLAAFGYNTARLNTGAYVNAMGYFAAYNNSGTDLVAIGRESARNNTGVNSVFIGMSAGRSNTGRLSLGIGDVALEENIGINSIGIGLGAGRSNTGESLIAVGTSTAGNNSGASSTFIGQISGYNNTGDFSVGLGYRTLLNNIGNESIAIGRESSTDNTGSFTIALGTGSLGDNVKDDVIGIGFQTAKTNNASRVIAIGYRAADDFTNPNTPLEGNNVTETILIGSHAGHNQGLAAGSEVHSHTIGIGSFALGNNNGSNVIAIGKDAGTANTQSNRVILGFNELPQFANAAAAAAAMPAAGTNGVYIYWDLSDNTIKVRP